MSTNSPAKGESLMQFALLSDGMLMKNGRGRQRYKHLGIMTVWISQFPDNCSGIMIRKIDRRHSLLICVHADPPVALLGPTFCPHPQMAVSASL